MQRKESQFNKLGLNIILNGKRRGGTGCGLRVSTAMEEVDEFGDSIDYRDLEFWLFDVCSGAGGGR